MRMRARVGDARRATNSSAAGFGQIDEKHTQLVSTFATGNRVGDHDGPRTPGIPLNRIIPEPMRNILCSPRFSTAHLEAGNRPIGLMSRRNIESMVMQFAKTADSERHDRPLCRRIGGRSAAWTGRGGRHCMAAGDLLNRGRQPENASPSISDAAGRGSDSV
jgi:hypothetical protein